MHEKPDSRMLSLLKGILIPCLLSCLWPVNVFAASGPIAGHVAKVCACPWLSFGVAAS